MNALEFIVKEDETVIEARRRWIGETIGYVSVLWEPRPQGVFDAERAAEATDALIAALEAEETAPQFPVTEPDPTIYEKG